ncbi:unnamed protein product (macronuclear) [Paramecium tetraurelia]|uniref:Uncharacterized protein n=1 Tax=Paramecium tetraurelia TaxID=5888 RepID=A0D749_PARTE|nr:uncharacterized protein GSPATT00001907001 [Paramecium tetraurelia]CAK78866.1 unnamed protein product [Paramecium tetraurelia]|eukprot:XP_001446263.1 hypothetical protein (macronuclear) [Paramecium tetraurelia strain d4-2]
MEQIQYGSASEYKSHIFQKNVSYYVELFIFQKLGQEAELNILCAFSRLPVKIPVRHQNIVNIECIYDLEVWMEFFAIKLKEQNNFSCPGCKQYVYFSDFGIDFGLYHILAEKQLLEQSGQKLLGNKIIYSLNNGKVIYYALSKQDKKTKLKIPGTNPIFRLQVSKNNLNMKNLNPRQQDILDQMNYTISKIKDFISFKMHQGKQKGIQINQMKQVLKAKLEQLKTTFRKSQNLVQLGVKSLESQFIFGLKKLQKDGKNAGSVLIVYYPHLGIWQDYEIKTTPEKHFQYEFQLYAKEQGSEKENIIYVIGGRVKNFESSNLFVRIRFPKDPFTLEKSVYVDYLPNLPNAAFNYLGGCYDNNVYIFCGQKRTLDQQGRANDTIFDVGYTFKNGQWNKLNEKVEKRYDGSCTIINHQKYDKCLILYGGIEQLLDGRVGYNVQQQQHVVQVFQFKQEKFLGKGFKLKFSDNHQDNYQKYMFSCPIFSIPYGTHSELLIAGEFLKTNYKEGREVYIFDWQEGTITKNQLQTQPLEQILLSNIQKNYNYSAPELLQPVQDIEGAFLFGNYYTIHQEEIQIDSRTTFQNFQLFEYKAANGQVSIRPFLQREVSIKQAIEALQNLPNQENKNL